MKSVTIPMDYDKFASDEFKNMAYQSAESYILKNQNNVVKRNESIGSGPNTNNMRCLNGAWSYSWREN